MLVQFPSVLFYPAFYRLKPFQRFQMKAQRLFALKTEICLLYLYEDCMGIVSRLILLSYSEEFCSAEKLIWGNSKIMFFLNIRSTHFLFLICLTEKS